MLFNTRSAICAPRKPLDPVRNTVPLIESPPFIIHYKSTQDIMRLGLAISYFTLPLDFFGRFDVSGFSSGLNIWHNDC